AILEPAFIDEPGEQRLDGIARHVALPGECFPHIPKGCFASLPYHRHDFHLRFGQRRQIVSFGHIPLLPLIPTCVGICYQRIGKFGNLHWAFGPTMCDPQYTPGMPEDIRALDQQYVMSTYKRLPGVYVRGEGCYM